MAREFFLQKGMIIKYEKGCIGNQYSGTVYFGAEFGIFTALLLLQGKHSAHEKILLRGWW